MPMLYVDIYTHTGIVQIHTHIHLHTVQLHIKYEQSQEQLSSWLGFGSKRPEIYTVYTKFSATMFQPGF
jgi:hypothetical protein